MPLRVAAILLPFAASCFALQVITPNALSGWTSEGPQTISWQRVVTDPANFTIVLTNQNRTLFPNDEVLLPDVDSTLLSADIEPPVSGWPTAGAGYRINLVLSPNDLASIFAQSDQFSIVETTASSTTSTTTTSSTSPTTSSTTSATMISTSMSTSSSSSSSPYPSADPEADYDRASTRRVVRITIGIVCTVIALGILPLLWWYLVRKKQAKARERRQAIRNWTIDDSDLPDGTGPRTALIGTHEGGYDPSEHGWYDPYKPYDPYIEAKGPNPTNKDQPATMPRTSSPPKSHVPLAQARPRNSTQVGGSQPRAGNVRTSDNRKSWTLEGREYRRSTLGMSVYTSDSEDVDVPLETANTGR